jgi:8-oxo-dGTP pyrophosphatase MutT (NUDIX family)
MLDQLWRIGLRCAYWGLRAWRWIRHPHVYGAYVAVWRGHDLLLIRNSYRAGETVPCGAIHRRETPMAAAARELFEEVGIEASEADLVPAGEVVVDFENAVDHAHFFELRVGAEAGLSIDRREVIWAGFVPAESLRERPLVPHLRRYLETALPDSQSAT